MIEFGGGLIWESEDGMNFTNPKQAFKRLAHYFGGELPKNSNLTKGDRGSKFERPQILMIDGKPSFMYGPSGTNTEGGKGSVSYVLKIREEFLPAAQNKASKQNLSKAEVLVDKGNGKKIKGEKAMEITQNILHKFFPLADIFMR